MACARKRCWQRRFPRVCLLVGAFVYLAFIGNVVMAQPLIGISHTVFGDIRNSDGSIPLDGDIRFSAMISSRPSEWIDGYGQVHDAYARPAQVLASAYRSGVLFLNTGNFATPWQPGEELFISITNTANGERANVRVPLTNAGADRFSAVLRAASLDVDDNGFSDANDGVMILRRLNGAGTVTTGIVLPQGATNTSVVSAIDQAGVNFDVDGDGDADANDGVMILRRLNGAGTVTTGIVLPQGVGGAAAGGARSNAEITGVIDALK